MHVMVEGAKIWANCPPAPVLIKGIITSQVQGDAEGGVVVRVCVLLWLGCAGCSHFLCNFTIASFVLRDIISVLNCVMFLFFFLYANVTGWLNIEGRSLILAS